MRGKNFVQVSAYPMPMQPRVFSPEDLDNQVHGQSPAWNNQLMLMRQRESLSPVSTVDSSIESAPKQRKRHKRVKEPRKKTSCMKIVLVILGALVAAIALAGMALGIYAVILLQQTTTTTTTTTTNATRTSTTTTTTTTSTVTTTTTSATTAAVLPGQCFSYTVYTDSTRLATAAGGGTSDISSFSIATIWIRFVGSGGTVMATSPPNYGRCGALYSGWFIDALPQTGSTVVGTVCYVSSTVTCYYYNLIAVTNCGSFYVYGLVDPPASNTRYCTV